MLVSASGLSTNIMRIFFLQALGCHLMIDFYDDMLHTYTQVIRTDVPYEADFLIRFFVIYHSSCRITRFTIFER